MDAAFLADRITATKAQIIAHETAYLNAVAAGVQSYTLDTGQTRNTATKYNIADYDKIMDSLLNRLTILEKRKNKTGLIVNPGW